MRYWVMPWKADLLMTHGRYDLWLPEIVALNALSNALIALAYFSIPLTLFYFVRKRRDLPATWFFLLLSLLIVASGTTHLMAIWTLWHPIYWLSGGIKLLTAIVSLTTAILLVPLVLKALALPSALQLEAANRALLCEINDRKQVEAAFQESEARFQTLVQNMPGMLYRYFPRADGTGVFTYVSAGSYELLELAPEQILHEASALWNLVHPADFPSLQATVAAAIQHRAQWQWEGRVTTPSGQLKWIQGNSRPQQTPDGVVWDGLLLDSTDRKEAEALLQRYERIISVTTDAIVLLDRNHVYQVVNQAYLNWHDKRQEDVVGHSVKDLFPLYTYETVIKPPLDQCWAGQVVQYEMWNNYPTLGRQFLSVTCAPYVDFSQTISGVVVSLRNITRLKQAEMELELQSVIASSIAEGICLVKAADSTIVYANPKFERMFGYDSGELEGQHVSIVNYTDEQTSAEAVNEAIQTDLLQHGEVTYEVRNVKKDGTPFWCQATASLFEHPDYGTVFVAVQQDITERKQSEAVIQASLKEKEVLLKEIHHRVKNNLGVVDGLLQMQSRRSHNADVIAALKESQNRIASIALVHEKLYSSDNLAEIKLDHYIADLTADLFDSYNIHPNQIKLTTQIDPISLDIDIAIPCGLIINELVSNALKYAFSNTRTGEIEVTFQQKADQTLTLTVSDNGGGLPPDFDLQQDKNLGMSLVQGLVKQLQGTLKIRDGAGTTVIITFAKGN